MRDALCFQQTMLAWQPILRRAGKFQRLPDVEVPGVVDGGLDAECLPFLVVLLNATSPIIDVQGWDYASVMTRVHDPGIAGIFSRLVSLLSAINRAFLVLCRPKRHLSGEETSREAHQLRHLCAGLFKAHHVNLLIFHAALVDGTLDFRRCRMNRSAPSSICRPRSRLNASGRCEVDPKGWTEFRRFLDGVAACPGGGPKAAIHSGLIRRSGRIPALPYPPIKPLHCTAVSVNRKGKTIHSGKKQR